MGRGSQQQAEANRENILRCASRLFRQKGVDQVSVAAVMGAAGLTAGGFYKHFASKEALVRESFALAFEQAAKLWRKLAAPQDLPSALQDPPNAPQKSPAGAVVQNYLRAQTLTKCCPLLAFAAHAAESGDPDAQAAYSAGAQKLFAQFREKLPPEDNAELLFAAMIGAGLLARASGDADWVEPLKIAVERAAGAAPPA